MIAIYIMSQKYCSQMMHSVHSTEQVQGRILGHRMQIMLFQFFCLMIYIIALSWPMMEEQCMRIIFSSYVLGRTGMSLLVHVTLCNTLFFILSLHGNIFNKSIAYLNTGRRYIAYFAGLFSPPHNRYVKKTTFTVTAGFESVGFGSQLK